MALLLRGCRMIEKLVFVRHGDYDHGSGELTEYGRKGIEKLAPRIREMLGDVRPTLTLASPRIRARQTAEILCQALNAPEAKLHDELLVEVRIERATKEVQMFHGAMLPILGEARCVLISAHAPVCDLYPSHYAEHVLGFKPEEPFFVEKAEAIVVDATARKLTHISFDH